MLAIWVKVKIKAAMRDKFLKAIEADALGSEKDEPGCLRFNVLQDEKDENVYYFYEVYKDQAALEAHRNTPHYAIWRGVADVLEGPTEPTRCKPVLRTSRRTVVEVDVLAAAFRRRASPRLSASSSAATFSCSARTACQSTSLF